MATPNQPNLGQTRQDILDIAAMTEETFRSVADSIQTTFRDAINQGQSMSKTFGNDIKNNLNSLARIASDSIANHEKLKRGLLTENDIQKQIASRAAKILSIENTIAAAKLAGMKISASTRKELIDTIKINEVYTQQLIEQEQHIITAKNEVNKQLGMTPKLLGGIDKTLSKLGLPNFGFDDALKKTHEIGQAADAGRGGFNAWKTYAKQVGSNLGESLSKANLMQAGIGLLIEAFFKLDSMIGDTAKSMGVSYQTAAQLNSEFVNMANNSGNLFVTTKGINESFNQINAALGTNGMLSKEILVTQTELVKQAFYSVEAATMLSKLSLATGKPTKEIAASFLGQVKYLNLVNGTAINEKQLLEDISKLSKDTLATFANQPLKLAEASYEARKLGLDLEKLKGTQSSLLDIESSIASEFEAEVITGKQLNLEKARYFALTNDYAGLARELGNQDITRASFAKTNILQQEATAKALGMSASTMGGMLLDQEAMSKLSGIDGDTAKERFNNLVKEVGLTEAKKRLGEGVLADQMASASIQDKFAASIEKLKEVFISLVDPLMPLLDVFSTIFELVGKIMKAINPLLQGFGFLVAAATDLLTIGGSGASGARMEAAALRLHESVTSDEQLARERTQPVQDGIAPSSQGPFTVTDRFGSTAITAPGDHIAVSPNMNQGAQSSGFDYDRLAQAISKVTVQSNLDGVRVSNELFNRPAASMALRKI